MGFGLSLLPLAAVFICALLCFRMMPKEAFKKISSMGSPEDFDDLAWRLASKANHHN